MEDQLVQLQSFPDPFQAHLAKSMLEAEGIRCYLQDENMIGLNQLYAPALGGVKLQVWKSDFERAKDLLDNPDVAASVLPITTPITSNVSKRALNCPQCGCSQILKRSGGVFSTVLSFLSLILLGISFGRAKRRVNCPNCGAQF